ncbi:fibrillarin [Candidatus Woesearchaeota archaeon]|nr:fibrillarin [Candidatus Woesearchaeota archaeon]|tara:strand:- start:3659 stop:4288 length:630 start_codon:yes stop_codon:yes gene_type:complete
MREILPQIFEHNKKLLTLSTDKFFSEEIVKVNDKKYREWNPTRSKLAAAIVKGLKVDIKPGDNILYLGAAHGYTPSFIACNKLFAVEFAPRVARELVILSEKKKNILPIIADANQPNTYYHLPQAVDIVYQDIAQRNQVEILVKNCNLFLKKNGLAMIAVKSRSIDVTQKPGKIFADVKRQLEEHFKILDYRNLEPMQKDHAFFVCRKR